MMMGMSLESHTDSLLSAGRAQGSPRPPAVAGNPRARGRSWWRALRRGAAARCPACGRGALYSNGLHVVNYCDHCGEELYHQRAERLGPLFSAFLALNVAAIVVFIVDIVTGAALWPMIALGAVAWIVSFWLLLPAAKGMVIGLQWAWRLHGFQYAAMCRPHAPPRESRTGRKGSAHGPLPRRA